MKSALGCVYINPTRKRGFDACVTLWVRAEELTNGLDSTLEAKVRRWIAERWPFCNPVFPGRDMPVEAWRALPNST